MKHMFSYCFMILTTNTIIGKLKQIKFCKKCALPLISPVIGGRLVIATVSSGSCPCSNVMTNVRCSLRKMTDIWREMMYEKIISKVKQL